MTPRDTRPQEEVAMVTIIVTALATAIALFAAGYSARILVEQNRRSRRWRRDGLTRIDR